MFMTPLTLFLNRDTAVFKIFFNEFRNDEGHCSPVTFNRFLKAIKQFLINIDVQATGGALVLLLSSRFMGVFSGHTVGNPFNKTRPNIAITAGFVAANLCGAVPRYITHVVLRHCPSESPSAASSHGLEASLSCIMPVNYSPNCNPMKGYM